MNLPPDVCIVACNVFEPELRALGVADPSVIYLDQSLHREPEKLRQELARTLGLLEQRETLKRVILLYGYCGGGLEGLSSGRLELVLPMVHDCIPLLLGMDSTESCPAAAGTFYLSPGWIEHGQTPYTEYFLTAQKYGMEDALWLGKQMLKSYSQVILIKCIAPLEDSHSSYAKAMARLFGLAYRQCDASRDWLIQLVAMRLDGRVQVIPPGESVQLKRYPSGQSLTRSEFGNGLQCQSR